MSASKTAKVVIAVDTSDQAEFAFNWYLNIVHKPDNYIVMVHVPESVLDADRNRMQYITSSSWEEAVDKEKHKVKEIENKYNALILTHGMSGRTIVESGSKPGEVITRIAEEEAATMIVMGTRGLGKVRRTIMGSVSDYVVHHAQCPVIVCRTQ